MLEIIGVLLLFVIPITAMIVMPIRGVALIWRGPRSERKTGKLVAAVIATVGYATCFALAIFSIYLLHEQSKCIAGSGECASLFVYFFCVIYWLLVAPMLRAFERGAKVT